MHGKAARDRLDVAGLTLAEAMEEWGPMPVKLYFTGPPGTVPVNPEASVNPDGWRVLRFVVGPNGTAAATVAAEVPPGGKGHQV